MSAGRWLATLGVGLLSLGSRLLRAETAIGDWGHFLSYTPTVFLHNPQGVAFDVRVHVMQWGTADWRREKVTLRLVAPDGEVLADGAHGLERSVASLAVAAGKPGVYRLHTTDNVWVASSLERSVVWTGVPGTHLMDDEPVPDPGGGDPRPRAHYEKRGHLVFQASVPRRWWFWVPPDAHSFRCTAMRADRCMSQREDWGFFVISPRGQRVRALWGQPQHGSGKDYRQDQTVEVEVEPGAAGRFWCLEVGLGDSHQYSNINIALDGVPPYLARSPEEWFDPRTGEPPAVPTYDDTPFMLGFRIGTYLPRGGMKAEPALAHVRIAGPEGQTLLEKAFEMRHLHDRHGHPTDTLATGKGVATVSVSGVERWMSFTYPATPLVLIGDAVGEWSRFRFTVCAPRNWYFFVPVGTREIGMRVAADIAGDVLHVELCAPDRVVALVYGNAGEQTVAVPAGLDGKIWYIRPSVGSATRMVSEAPPFRYQDIPATLELKGVPGYLAPTWEQWFDARRPAAPRNRSEGASRYCP